MRLRRMSLITTAEFFFGGILLLALGYVIYRYLVANVTALEEVVVQVFLAFVLCTSLGVAGALAIIVAVGNLLWGLIASLGRKLRSGETIRPGKVL